MHVRLIAHLYWRYRRLLCFVLLSMLAFGLHTGLAGQEKAVPPKSPVAVEKPRYRMVVVCSAPHIADDIAPGLNRSGQVAAWRRQGDLSVRAFLWTQSKMIDLGVPAGYKNSIARAVNMRGEAAGWSNTSENPVDSQSTTHAVFFTGGKVRDLGTLGGKNSQAFGLNDLGEVVGVSSTAANARHAFLYRQGKMQDLGTLSTGSYSMAFGINRQGEVTGVGDFQGRVNHAWLWRKGVLRDLGTLPGGNSSFARALNAKGQVVGFGKVGDDVHGFLFSGDRMQDLGDLGDDPTTANDINDRGVIVGASTTGRAQRHAFLWEKGRMIDLNALIRANTGWTLREAYRINEAGEILCIGINRARVPYFLLLKPTSALTP